LIEVDLPIQSNEHRNKTRSKASIVPRQNQMNIAQKQKIKQRRNETTKSQQKKHKKKKNLIYVKITYLD
jgi:hypothetical protein